MEIALFEPRIPQNTGSIARTCAAFNLKLNLIEPLGFKLEDKYLEALVANEAVISKNVTENIFHRHIEPLFLGR